MTDFSLLTLNVDARGVAYVTLNRPEIHNAFDDALIAEITLAFAAIDANPAVRVAVLAGNGKSFCAGGDINWMRKMKAYSRAENVEDSAKLELMFAQVAGLTKPLVGVVHGNAMGGGAGLAAACDFVIAEEDTRFGFTETRLGIAPSVISPYVIEKIGLSYARAYFLSGAVFSAEVAKEMQLVHRVVTATELAVATEETVQEFLRAAPGAAARTKALIAQVKALSQDKNARAAIREFTIETIADLRVGDEGQEGMDALLTKRKPNWTVA